MQLSTIFTLSIDLKTKSDTKTNNNNKGGKVELRKLQKGRQQRKGKQREKGLKCDVGRIGNRGIKGRGARMARTTETQASGTDKSDTDAGIAISNSYASFFRR